MWQYNNVSFIYGNEVDGVFNTRTVVPKIFTYRKSKFALMEALRQYVEESNLGPYADIDPRTVKHDPPINTNS